MKNTVEVVLEVPDVGIHRVHHSPTDSDKNNTFTASVRFGKPGAITLECGELSEQQAEIMALRIKTEWRNAVRAFESRMWDVLGPQNS